MDRVLRLPGGRRIFLAAYQDNPTIASRDNGCLTAWITICDMNTSLTEIAFILDRSGSMQPLAEQAVTGFNSFLAEQQQAKGKARITLVL